ncbi:MAG: hypothetical protein AB7L66_19190 [Gemmatimonadales bacterium]
MSLAELFRSFEDLWTHFDSADAARFGAPAPLPALDAFDEASNRQHGAAFRSLALAVEELEVESLDEELDRTLLLTAIRTRLRRLEKERPERGNPALWCHRLAAAVAARAGDADTLARIPGWVDALRDTLRKPPLIHLQVALEHLGMVRLALEGESWWQADKETLSRANASLELLERFLRHEVEPDPEPMAGALRPDRVEWRLHFEHLIESTGGEALRRLSRRLELLDGGHEEPEEPAAAPVSPGEWESLSSSEIRSRLMHPAWMRAWGLFTDTRAGRTRGAVLAQARIGALDLAIQMTTISAADAARRLAESGEATGPEVIGALVTAPLEEAATALLVERWEALARRWPGGGALEDVIRRSGLYHPDLARWRLGLTE